MRFVKRKHDVYTRDELNDIMRRTSASLAMEGLNLTDDDKCDIRDCLTGACSEEEFFERTKKICGVGLYDRKK